MTIVEWVLHRDEKVDSLLTVAIDEFKSAQGTKGTAPSLHSIPELKTGTKVGNSERGGEAAKCGTLECWRNVFAFINYS